MLCARLVFIRMKKIVLFFNVKSALFCCFGIQKIEKKRKTNKERKIELKAPMFPRVMSIQGTLLVFPPSVLPLFSSLIVLSVKKETVVGTTTMSKTSPPPPTAPQSPFKEDGRESSSCFCLYYYHCFLFFPSSSSSFFSLGALCCFSSDTFSYAPSHWLRPSNMNQTVSHCAINKRVRRGEGMERTGCALHFFFSFFLSRERGLLFFSCSLLLVYQQLAMVVSFMNETIGLCF
eukprot:TRINITY_DN4260_c0_g1_i1.p1 TRINITY_DN4260_c0_g1~~TRINITY_DN4260_c0_g1_i1.p1  ORF type:complete len:233 (+),score=15.24 TRINITY_DN4260_c0_g1_i1:343-1041(+)